MAIKLLDEGFRLHCNEWWKDYLCDTDADLEHLPQASAGSVAVSIQSGKVRIVNTQGEWVPFAEEK